MANIATRILPLLATTIATRTDIHTVIFGWEILVVVFLLFFKIHYRSLYPYTSWLFT